MENLVGRIFGRLLVVAQAKSDNGNRRWLCRCECGNEKVIRGCSLKYGRSKSCGCLQKEKASILGQHTALTLEGERFGKLVVIARSGTKGKKSQWNCRCECGKEKVVSSRSLVSGKTQSCGCYHREVWQRLISNPELTDEERELQRERRCDPKTVEWRKKVYERDGYVCQACGYSEGGKLVAHHKESWNSNRDLRFDVGNGTTSCQQCHNEFHSIFGYGNNTAEEWDKFLKSKGVDGVRFTRPVKNNVRILDLVNRRFGKLVVIRIDDRVRPIRWICGCDCGNTKSVDGHGLKKGVILSCGCLKKEQARIMGKRNRRTICLM